jgi:hypothetical protein
MLKQNAKNVATIARYLMVNLKVNVKILLVTVKIIGLRSFYENHQLYYAMPDTSLKRLKPKGLRKFTMLSFATFLSQSVTLMRWRYEFPLGLVLVRRGAGKLA